MGSRASARGKFTDKKMTSPSFLRLASAAALVVSAVAAHAEAPFSFTATPGKLPKDVVPVQYAAHLIPDLAANTFLGSETVEIDVLQPTSVIMLNVANIEVDLALLTGKGADHKLVPVVDKTRETLSFALEQPLAPGRYQLALKFHGVINREGRGMFYLPYKVGNASKTMVVTTMEPSDARRMLPTWDEPSFRANFKLTVDLPANFKAYSNMPVETQEKLQGGLLRHTFGTTPKMPSYLLVLVAGELERSTAKQDGTEIGVVTTAGKQASAAYALGASKDLLHYYNKYFGVPYPLPKLDQIAIPGGFNGAMENWGAIVYNEAALLYDPKTSPESMMELSFSVNAHEMAHQWFGNLVTMAWWDNLWLNEGFASWMGAKATANFHPEWRVELSSLAGREGVMNLDARKTTHPIQTAVLTEEQAANAFDDITYIKGQAFLRMLEAYLGEDAFRKGIRAYMARHQYSNTTSADLWSALEKASGKPVAKLATDWTTQPGFPLIKVIQACEGGKRRVTLTQEQYRIDEPAPEARLWNVPVQLGTVGGKATYTMLSGAHTTVVMPGCDGALVADPDSMGYFRVQYDSATFDALAAQAPKLPDATRLRLLSDAWSLAQGGRGKLDSYLKLVARYGDEPRYSVWDAITNTADQLDALARGEPERAQVRRFVITLASPKFGKLGWQEKPGESGEDRRLRPLLATALASAGDVAALAQARTMFARYLADPASVSPSMLAFVTEVGARQADAATWEALFARTTRSQNNEERTLLASALASSADKVLAARTLKLALSPELPAQVSARITAWVAREHPRQAWDFAVANRELLLRDQDAVGKNVFFPSLLQASVNPADADMLEDFVAKHFGPDAQDEARRVANGIRTRAAQKKRLLPQMRAGLK